MNVKDKTTDELYFELDQGLNTLIQTYHRLLKQQECIL